MIAAVITTINSIRLSSTIEEMKLRSQWRLTRLSISLQRMVIVAIYSKIMMIKAPLLNINKQYNYDDTRPTLLTSNHTNLDSYSTRRENNHCKVVLCNINIKLLYLLSLIQGMRNGIHHSLLNEWCSCSCLCLSLTCFFSSNSTSFSPPLSLSFLHQLRLR